MKRLFLLFASVAVAAMVSCSPASRASQSARESADAEVVSLMLGKKFYKMDFTRVYPMSGPSFPLNYPYFVSVTGDRVESFMPYFGRAYTLPYGGGEGLRFDAPITGYTVSEGRRGQRKITFRASTAEDSYTFNIEIYPSGKTNLTVYSANKQSISFSGQMDLDAGFETIRIAE